MSTSRVLVCGELLLRLDTPGHQRFVQADKFHLTFTGGEANVAVALSQWGVSSAIISAVPSNEIGQACLNHLGRYGVETSLVIWSGQRLGILFVETGAGQRGSRVIYDRDETSFRRLQPDDLNWTEAFNRRTHFHFTGTSLVSPGTRAAMLKGLHIAKENNIQISFDASYRSSLWSVAEAKSAFEAVMPFVDLFIGSEQDASTFFGINSHGNDAMIDLAAKYQLSGTAFTQRVVNNEGVNQYSAKLFDGNDIFSSPDYSTIAIDRIGTGDAFAAGLIYGLIQRIDPQSTLNFATAAAVLKHTIPGDFALLSLEEIEALVEGEGIGRVQR